MPRCEKELLIRLDVKGTVADRSVIDAMPR